MLAPASLLILISLLLSANGGGSFETCSAASAFDPPPSLKNRGTIYVLQNNLGLTGGGARFLHELHRTLLVAGLNSKMHYVHPAFADPMYSNNLSSIEEWGLLLENGLGPSDVLVWPELVNSPGLDQVVDALEKNQVCTCFHLRTICCRPEGRSALLFFDLMLSVCLKSPLTPPLPPLI